MAAGNNAVIQPVFDDLILHISPDKFYFESLTANKVSILQYSSNIIQLYPFAGCVCDR